MRETQATLQAEFVDDRANSLPKTPSILRMRLRASWDDFLRRDAVPRAHPKPFTLRLGLTPHR